MKAKLFIPLIIAATLSSVSGATIVLEEWAVNIDGTVSDPTLGDPIPPGVVASPSFLLPSGLGTVTMTVTGVGAHYLGLFVDHSIDETLNTFFNEYGATSGTPAAGQSWEIDEPGFVFGDIYTNFGAGTLDNMIFDGTMFGPEDVSMAMGWNFSLLAGETATATFLLSQTVPTSGFYLRQTDPNSQASIYFSSSLSKNGGSNNLPDGGCTFILLLTSMTGLALFRKPLRNCRG